MTFLSSTYILNLIPWNTLRPNLLGNRPWKSGHLLQKSVMGQYGRYWIKSHQKCPNLKEDNRDLAFSLILNYKFTKNPPVLPLKLHTLKSHRKWKGKKKDIYFPAQLHLVLLTYTVETYEQWWWWCNLLLAIINLRLQCYGLEYFMNIRKKRKHWSPSVVVNI